jgi:hypothetical protein
MKKLSILFTAVVFLASCKKTYHCTCNTTSTALQNGGYVNQAQYTVKMYGQEAAHDKCLDMYNNSDYVQQTKPASTDIKCEVISPK